MLDYLSQEVAWCQEVAWRQLEARNVWLERELRAAVPRPLVQLMLFTGWRWLIKACGVRIVQVRYEGRGYDLIVIKRHRVFAMRRFNHVPEVRRDTHAPHPEER